MKKNFPTFAECVQAHAVTTKIDKTYINAAHRLYHDGGRVEVDFPGIVSKASVREGGGDGAYVMAWVWVYKDDIIKKDKV